MGTVGGLNDLMQIHLFKMEMRVIHIKISYSVVYATNTIVRMGGFIHDKNVFLP